MWGTTMRGKTGIRVLAAVGVLTATAGCTGVGAGAGGETETVVVTRSAEATAQNTTGRETVPAAETPGMTEVPGSTAAQGAPDATTPAAPAGTAGSAQTVSSTPPGQDPAGTSCGSIPTYGGRSTPVAVESGAVSCATALEVARTYLASPGEGQANLKQVGEWSCSRPIEPGRSRAESRFYCRVPAGMAIVIG